MYTSRGEIADELWAQDGVELHPTGSIIEIPRKEPIVQASGDQLADPEHQISSDQ
jgi:hypothetical protein